MDIRDRMVGAVFRAQRAGEYETFVKPGIAAGKERHAENIANLYKGLDEQAAQRLSAILQRREKILDPAVISYQQLYTEDEYRDFERFERFSKDVFSDGECFCYENYRLPIKNFESSVFLHQHGLSRLKTIEATKGKAIMDVGAFICDSALVFREHFPTCRVYSFEPNEKNYALARKTLTLNELSDDAVVLENLALGDRPGQAVITEAAKAGACIIANKAAAGQSVAMDTLDNYVARHTLQVGLIKVDVEGYERHFLRGALETIKQQRPILLVSIYHNYDDFFHIKPFIDSLNLGYTFDFFKGIDSSVWADIMLLCEVK